MNLLQGLCRQLHGPALGGVLILGVRKEPAGRVPHARACLHSGTKLPTALQLGAALASSVSPTRS